MGEIGKATLSQIERDLLRWPTQRRVRSWSITLGCRAQYNLNKFDRNEECRHVMSDSGEKSLPTAHGEVCVVWEKACRTHIFVSIGLML